MASPVATIKSNTLGLDVTRAGQQLALEKDAALAWGDVLTNTTNTDIEVMLPPQYEGQGSTLLSLAPGASAELREVANPTVGGASRTEVVALSEGVELYDVADEVSSATLVPYEGATSGLIGAGLLASGAGLGPAAALAGLGILGFAASSDDNVINGGDGDGDKETTTPMPSSSSTPVTTDKPDDPDPSSVSTTAETTPATTDAPEQAIGAAGLVSEAANGLVAGGADTPLAPLTDGLGFFLGGDTAAADPSGGQITDAGFNGLSNLLVDVGTQVAGAGAADPTGLVPLVGTVAGALADTPIERPVGVAGGLDSVAQAIDQGASEDGALTGPLRAALIPVAGGVGTLSDAVVMVSDAASAIPGLGPVLQPVLGKEADATPPATTPAPGGENPPPTTPAPSDDAGPVLSGAQQLVDAAPIEQIPQVGQTIEDGILAGAEQLDGLLGGGVPSLPGAGSGGGGSDENPIVAGAQQLVDAAPIEQIPQVGQTIEDAIIAGAEQLGGLLGGGAPSLPGGGDNPLVAGAQQLVDAAPIEQIPQVGQTIEDGIVSGAEQLAGLLSGEAPSLPGGGGGLPSLPGGDDPIVSGAEQLVAAAPLEQIPQVGQTIEDGIVSGAEQLSSALSPITSQLDPNQLGSLPLPI
ncbi:MAG: hypothetical protein ACK4FF_03545 [Limnobacter sp.]|uniref:hypothetical protein n=1 Tax=Limnobacter sp. TaxID=2003368 RepID=UPI00391B3201